MFMSTRRVVWLVIAGGALAAEPALAVGQTPPVAASYTSFDSGGGGATFRWYVDGTTATDTTIAQGATVTFTTPAGAGPPHNVNFPDEPKPTCKLSTSDAGSPPPMPAAVARGWTGTCGFDQPGAYRFVCDRHPAMTEPITVFASPPPTATPVANVPAPPPTPTGPSATGAAPAAPRAAIWVKVDHHQSGTRVHGS